jgi:uncharacterized damage-inducible protein DinB
LGQMIITRKRRCPCPDLPRLARNIQTGLQAANREALPFRDMNEHAKKILIDAFGRVRGLVIDLTDDLTEEIATYRPDPGANSIAWLIWHVSRIQDDHVADLAQVEQAWVEWRERFGLPFGKWATGYGQGPEEVAAVRVSGDLLADYHRAVHELTQRYLESITAEELDRIVDTHWDPPVTAAVRLVSVIGDTMQHLGQAAYVRGLAQRRDSAWHQSSAADR